MVGRGAGGRALSRTPSRRFDLLGYFTRTSLVILLLFTIAEGLVSAMLVRAVFTRMEHDEADSLSEYFVTELADNGYPRASWGVTPIPPVARERAVDDMRNFDVTELQLLTPEGRALTTLVAPGKAGSALWARGLSEAESGRPALRWEATGGWRSILLSAEPSGAIESYLPVREGEGVAAVVKVRRDLQPAVAATQRLLLAIVGLSALAGIAAFASLALLVRRADRILGHQHAELAEARAALELRNRRLEELNRKKDEFYAACGHDLRSPLLSAHAGTRLLLADGATPVAERHREILEDNLRAVERVLEQIRSLLDSALAEGSEEAMELESLDLARLLEDVVATHRGMAAARSVPIATTWPEGPTVVEGDRLKLSRVFANLVSNAIKHARGRPVAVALERLDDAVRVVVSDEGTSIAQELRARIFERGVRGPAETDQGAGLGLAIVHEFVTRHGGRVAIENGTERGTRFVVDLPAGPIRRGSP